jgi:hypothetical protein
MTEQEVISILGQGKLRSSSDTGNGSTKLIEWETNDGSISVGFADGKVSSTTFVANSPIEGQKGSAAQNPAKSVETADEEFRVQASQKGQRATVAATMLIDRRNGDKWSWEMLEGEVNFQFSGIKQQFNNWKRDRIAAGDRYK